MIRRSIWTLALAAAALLFQLNGAIAQEAREYPVRILTVPNSPVTITNCRSAGFRMYATVMNRTPHQMLSVAIQWKFYDTDSTGIGNRTVSIMPGAPLATADTSILDAWLGGTDLSEPQSSLSFLTCRVMAATFTGRKTWLYGQKWPEKLLPIPPADLGSQQSGLTATITGAGAARSDFKFAVSNAWNDTLRDGRGGIIVHDSLVLNGGSVDTTIRSSSFALTMALANGAKKTYFGLMQAAPTYLKTNPLGSDTTTAYQVDPKSDLGGLGSIIVPAHGTVTVTVSFAIEDVVADPNANREVTRP